jgi:hypothetical protein
MGAHICFDRHIHIAYETRTNGILSQLGYVDINEQMLNEIVKEQKHPITKAVLAPMKAVKKMLVTMELHLDASIDKLDNLAMNVKLDKEKHMENAKVQEQTEPERAEAERVEAEIVYSPMVAEPQEYQYNADAFENYLRDNAANDNKNKEIIMQKDKNVR